MKFVPPSPEEDPEYWRARQEWLDRPKRTRARFASEALSLHLAQLADLVTGTIGADRAAEIFAEALERILEDAEAPTI